MLHKLRTRAQDEKGFTLIELLVVILIIGILAAIALPAFLNQRTKAQDTEAKSKARTAQTALETYYVNEQTYVGADLATLQGIEPSLNDGPPLAVSVSRHGDVDGRRHVEVRPRYLHHREDQRGRRPTVTRTCTAGGKGGCPTTGKW